MTDEEIRLRALYVFLGCQQAIDDYATRLLESLPAASEVQLPVEKMVTRELGLLFRYWATQHIWKVLETEHDAKNFNLAVLRQFFDGLRLPKDGSGICYAERLTIAEQTSELSKRLSNQIGIQAESLLEEFQHEVPAWHASVINYTEEALHIPLERLQSSITEWAKRA